MRAIGSERDKKGRDCTRYGYKVSLHRFGPTPRLCIQKPLDTDQLEEYKNETRRALANLTLQSLRELTNDIKDLKMDLVSHKLCLISREKLHNVRSSFHITPITTHMQSRLAIRMRNQDIQRLVEMYQDFDRHPFSKGLSGHLFENIGHLYFQKQIIIEYASMTRLSSNGQKNHPQWHSSHPIHNEEDSELKKLRQDAWDSRTVLDVTPTDIQEYGDQEFRELDPKPNIYYIPKMKNEEALDSFIWYKGCGAPSFKTMLTKRRASDAGTDNKESNINTITVTYLCIPHSWSQVLLHLQTILSNRNDCVHGREQCTAVHEQTLGFSDQGLFCRV